MGWASGLLPRLAAGETVKVRPHGNSMMPRIKSGQQVTISPVTSETARDLEVGDVVLCKVNGRQLLHLLSAKRGDQVQISNNHGHVDGWIGYDKVFGKLINVES